MAFVTKYTFGKLCNRIEIKDDITLEFFLSHVFNNREIYFIFNRIELKYIFNYKNFLEDADKFWITYYKKVDERVDTKSYVFEKAGKLKYHLFADCPFVSKDFIDYHIPQDIKDIGAEAVDEYRQWFKDMNFAVQFAASEIDSSRVVQAYNNKFVNKYNLKPLPLNSNLIQHLANSKTENVDEDFDYGKFISELNHLIASYRNNFSSEVTRRLAKFDGLLDKSDREIEIKMSEIFSAQFVSNFGILNVRSRLHESKAIKRLIVTHLVDYFKWAYKFNEKKFSPITLENFDLECCGSCKKMDVSNGIII